jgi:hypothetical protein
MAVFMKTLRLVFTIRLQKTSDESPWPPPYFVQDIISGEYQIYHKGLLRPAEPGEAEGLEEAAVYDANHIIDRILAELRNR